MGVVVAIDGPSGSGKSSTAKGLASRAGWNYLDTGALYRAATWLANSKEITDAAGLLVALKESPITFKSDPKDPRTFCGGIDISREIRDPAVTDRVSVISAWREIREELVTLQRKIISSAKEGIIVEGRDIGTVVVP
ncbi:MAG: hypothetical protein RLZZ99_590, partial [Actinomycetota bacterium]